ncbi:AraC family transcriptional regulator [Neptuniibacter halophilus]|uniref:AraC family transcriptional regulator n=1 Tax=Neptuniibacter halophilus TaxID=651666 RepID=UPI0025746C10|nr:helix-turn-helix transcriptional regulator [Neptuniibacter halophilus]
MSPSHASKRLPSQIGQRIDPDRPIIGLRGRLAANVDMDPHAHPRAQLAYAAEGIIRVYTNAGVWVVPPSQAVWIPGGIEHRTTADVSAELRHLFIDPAYQQALSSQCSVVEVSPLLRELILRVADFGEDYAADSPARRICAVILDELQALKPSLLHLPGASDRRLQRVMQAMIAAPNAELGLDYWAGRSGASARTISRLFTKETGMSFQQWRRQLLLQEAVDRLGKGQAVTDIALELGYRSPSAFVAMFRKALGRPPGQYFRESPV